MWSHFIRITIWFQTIFPVRIGYNKQTHKFEPTRKRNWYFHWAWIQLMQTIIAAFFRVLNYMRTPKHKLTMTFLDFIVDFFFWGAGVVIPASLWTLWYRMDEYCWFLNQGYKLRKLEDKKLNKMVAMLYAIASFSLVASFCIASLPFVFENTAIHVIVGFYLPNEWMENRIFVKTLMAVYVSTNMFGGIAHPNQQLLSIIMIFTDSSHYLKASYLEPSPGIRRLKVSKGRPGIEQACLIYKSIYLLWRGLMQFGIVLFPCLIFVGVIIASVCTFATIKLHNELPAIIVAGFAVFGTMVLLTLVFTCDILNIIELEVGNFHKFWSNEIVNKLGKRFIRSLSPIRINIGNFFSFQSDTFLIIAANIIDMTVTMMVA